MKIISYNCPCGNNDASKIFCYDGLMGYEAAVCMVCGRYCDVNGEHEPCEWSMGYVKKDKGCTCGDCTCDSESKAQDYT